MVEQNKFSFLVRWLICAVVLLLAAFPARASAAPGPVFLPFINKSVPPPAGQEIKNPGFENGNTGWLFFVDVGDPILVDTLFNGPTHSARLGFLDPTDPDNSFMRTASVYQRIFVPTSQPILQFYEYINSQEEADPLTNACYETAILGDWVRFYVDGKAISNLSLCQVINTTGWVVRQLNLDAYKGRYISFKVEYKSDATVASDYYVDDFSFPAVP